MFGLFDAFADPTGSKKIDKGMEAQQWATGEANKKLDQSYADQKAYIAPWNNAGLGALSGMQSSDFQRDFNASDFQKDPGYEFRLAEGNKALERSAAARGSVQSGATLKALSRYNQDFATNEYNNVYNRFNADRDRRYGRLSTMAGMGENAMSMGVSAAGAYGNAYSNNLTNMGNATAAGNIAKANANQQLIGSFVSGGSKIASAGMA